MTSQEKTIQEILDNIPTERKEAFHRLHHVIVDNLPEGFEVGISYGMLGYVVPHSIYPAGYHCKKKNRFHLPHWPHRKIRSIFITWASMPIPDC